MKKEKILGICKFGSNIVELVGEAQLIRSIFLSSVLFTNFGSTNYRLVSLAGTGWGHKDIIVDGVKYNINFNIYNGVDNENNEDFYMITRYPENLTLQQIKKPYKKW
jgi:hypothetical protein